MKTIEGHDVKIFTDNIEDAAVEQIERLLSVGVFNDCKIRIMPDVHAGAGCVIGFTGNLGKRVIPNIVGVDIGCGMQVLKFRPAAEITHYEWLSDYIRKNIPSGRDVNDLSHIDECFSRCEIDGFYGEAKKLVKSLYCFRELKDVKRLYASIGTLGGGNHFIEVDVDDEGYMYIVIHTGSRNLGNQVANIYQRLAIKNRSGWDKLMARQNEMITEYKASGRKNELQDAIRDLHNSFKMNNNPDIPNELCYLEGHDRENYLHDMRICQEWANINRKLILSKMVRWFVQNGIITDESEMTSFKSVHNYIDDGDMVRKGAISAGKGEMCIIPLNMRDGSLICVGKGDEEWNCSAPHGAGRIMSRTKAFNTLSMDDFRQEMRNVWSDTVCEETLDESPMCYKPSKEIIENIGDTVEIISTIRPVYNFKAAE